MSDKPVNTTWCDLQLGEISHGLWLHISHVQCCPKIHNFYCLIGHSCTLSIVGNMNNYTKLWEFQQLLEIWQQWWAWFIKVEMIYLHFRTRFLWIMVLKSTVPHGKARQWSRETIFLPVWHGSMPTPFMVLVITECMKRSIQQNQANIHNQICKYTRSTYTLTLRY